MKNRAKPQGKPVVDLNLFAEVLKQPAQSFKRLKSQADLPEALKFIVLASAIAGLLKIIGTKYLLLNLGSVLETLIRALAQGLVGSVVIVGVPFLMAVLIGGKGGFNQQYYLTSLFLSPLIVLNALFRFLPFSNVLLTVAGVYFLYLFTLVLMEVHGFNFLRALLVWLVPFIIIITFFVTLAAALLGFFFAQFALAG